MKNLARAALYALVCSLAISGEPTWACADPPSVAASTVSGWFDFDFPAALRRLSPTDGLQVFPLAEGEERTGSQWVSFVAIGEVDLLLSEPRRGRLRIYLDLNLKEIQAVVVEFEEAPPLAAIESYFQEQFTLHRCVVEDDPVLDGEQTGRATLPAAPNLAILRRENLIAEMFGEGRTVEALRWRRNALPDELPPYPCP